MVTARNIAIADFLRVCRCGRMLAVRQACLHDPANEPAAVDFLAAHREMPGRFEQVWVGIPKAIIGFICILPSNRASLLDWSLWLSSLRLRR